MDIAADHQPTESTEPMYLDSSIVIHRVTSPPTATNVIYTVARRVAPSFVKLNHTTATYDVDTEPETDPDHHHQRASTAGDQQLVCLGCGSVYKNSNHLRRHVQYECGKAASMACDRCHAKFKRPDSLRRHMQKSCLKKKEIDKAVKMLDRDL